MSETFGFFSCEFPQKKGSFTRMTGHTKLRIGGVKMGKTVHPILVSCKIGR